MIQRFPEHRSPWLNLVGNTMPPRQPNNNEEEEDNDEQEEQREPAVIREPDEDD